MVLVSLVTMETRAGANDCDISNLTYILGKLDSMLYAPPDASSGSLKIYSFESYVNCKRVFSSVISCVYLGTGLHM